MVDTIVAAAVGALTAKAIDGLADAAKKKLTDGYAKLKSLLLRHVDPEGGIADALKKVEEKPGSEARQAVLAEELEVSGAAKNLDIQQQANILLDLVKSFSVRNTSSQTAIGTGIAQADRGSSASVSIVNHSD